MRTAQNALCAIAQNPGTWHQLPSFRAVQGILGQSESILGQHTVYAGKAYLVDGLCGTDTSLPKAS